MLSCRALGHWAAGWPRCFVGLLGIWAGAGGSSPQAPVRRRRPVPNAALPNARTRVRAVALGRRAQVPQLRVWGILVLKLT